MTESFQIGYQLAPAQWKKGYGTEAGSAAIDYALGTIESDRLVTYPRQENRRSKRVLEKLGFIQDGTCENAARNWCPFLVLARNQCGYEREQPTLAQFDRQRILSTNLDLSRHENKLSLL